MKNSKDIHNFNKLFNSHYKQFVCFAIGYVKDEAKAEDYVSEAFTAFWECKETLPNDTNVPAYILTIVKNKCLNYLKHRKVKLRAIEELTDHAQWVQRYL